MNTLKVHVGAKTLNDNNMRYSSRKNLQWIRDYKLVEWGPRSLFPEYLEMGKYMKPYIYINTIINTLTK